MTRGDRKLRRKPSVSLDKHDILYSRARDVLNQRHVKRPWFNLNPFLERMDEKIDLEEFVPDESKYIQKLESLVLCQSYSCDYPLDTKELTIAMFFPYLYSDIWEDGISLRILKGQLFDQLLLSLYKLEKEGSIVRHKTYAFARNQRPRTGCYKLADKETFGHIDEQLLIEFTYFGDLDKPEPNLMTTNPLDYLQRYRLRPDDNKEASTINLPPIETGPLSRRSRAASISIDTAGFKQKHSQDPSFPTDKRRGSLFTKSINAIRAISAMQPTTQSGRRPSMPASGPAPFIKTFAPAPPPSSDKRRWSEQGGSEPTQRPQRRRVGVAGNDMSGFEIPKVLQKLLEEAREFDTLDELEETKKKTLKSKTVSNGKERAESLEKLSAEEDQYYGEELYLSDQTLQDMKKPQKAEKMLQKKKMELQQRRKEQRQLAEVMAEKKHEIEEKLKLNSVPDFQEKELHYFLKWPEKVPSFEEFIRLMTEEEYVDPRYRNKEKRRTKRVAKRFNLEKEALRSKITISTVEVCSSSSQRLTSTSSKHDGGYRRGSMMGPGSRGTVRLPPLHELNVENKDTFAEQVHGVTDSEPCKEHCLKVLTACEKEKEAKEKRQSDREKMKQKRKDPIQPDIVVKSPSGVEQVVHKSPTSSRSSSFQKFPRFSLDEGVIESPVLHSDEDEESDDDTSSFDSTKLKLNYSIERLRKKRRRAKKRPAFLDVLKKYYRAQAALQAFRKNSLDNEQRATKERARKFSIGKYLKKPKEEHRPPTPPMVIGKLKKFRFLDVNAQKPKQIRLDDFSKADFSAPKIEDFEKELEKSLKDFVVRREIVASDLNARCATSITFTRKQSFKAKQ